MSREVRHDAEGPDVLDESDLGDDGKVYVCRCGLSDEKPLCDGSHKLTADEDDDTVYRYDGTERRAVEALEFADE